MTFFERKIIPIKNSKVLALKAQHSHGVEAARKISPKIEYFENEVFRVPPYQISDRSAYLWDVKIVNSNRKTHWRREFISVQSCPKGPFWAPLHSSVKWELQELLITVFWCLLSFLP